MVYPKYPACLVFKMIVGPGWTAIVFDLIKPKPSTRSILLLISLWDITLSYNLIVIVNDLLMKLQQTHCTVLLYMS